MTMDNELLKEAVELADGWQVTASGDIISPIAAYVGEPMHKCFIAALASQLISQVDAMEGFDFVSDEEKGAAVYPATGDSFHYAEGPNRDENSIQACVEFLRGERE